MENGMIFLIVVAVLIGGGAVWFVSVMNRFARLLVKVTEADSGIDVALTKRFDTLTKLLDVTKAYAKHEAETLSKMVSIRQGLPMRERSEISRQMSDVASQINVVAEAYPELRSSDNFKELQQGIVEVEEHLQAARRIYNMNVSAFNQLLVTWPASIVGRIKGHTARDFFAAEEGKKADVAMQF